MVACSVQDTRLLGCCISVTLGNCIHLLGKHTAVFQPGEGALERAGYDLNITHISFQNSLSDP